MMPPTNPVIITAETVSGTIPPTVLETSMASGVVMDLGANEIITSL